MQEKRKFIINITIVITLSIIASYFAIHNDFEGFVHQLRNLKWWQIIIIISWGTIYYSIGGLSIKLFGNIFDPKYSLKDGIQNSIICGCFNGLTPSSTGGQIAQSYFLMKNGFNGAQVACILWLDFIVFQLVLVSMVLFLFILKFQYFLEQYSAFIVVISIGILINLVIAIVLWTVSRFHRFYYKVFSIFISIGHKLRIVKDKEKATNKVNTFILDFSNYTKIIKQHKKIVAYSAFIHVFRFLMIYSFPLFIAKFVGIDLSWSMLLEVMALTSFVMVSAAFVPLPGASGVSEALFVGMFSTIMTRQKAASIMVLWRFGTYHAIVVVGLIIYIVLKRKYALRGN